MERQRIRLDLDGRLIATADDYTVTGVHDDHREIELINVRPVDHEAAITLASWTWRDMKLIVERDTLRYVYAGCGWRAFSYTGEFQGLKLLRYRITAKSPEKSSVG